MVNPSSHADVLAGYRRSVIERLAHVRRRMRGQLIVEGFAWVLGTIVVLAASSLVYDRFVRPDMSIRTVLLVIGIAALGFIAIRRLYRPLTLKIDDLDLAELLERRQKGTGERVANVLLLPQLEAQDPSVSPAMIRAAVHDDFAALQKVDLQASFDNARRRNMWLLVLGLLVPAIALCIANPAMASLWARRWFAGAEIRWPQQTYLNVAGLGDSPVLHVPRGEAVLLEIDSQPTFESYAGYWKLTGRGEPLLIESKDRPVSHNPDSVLLRLTLADGTLRQGTFTQFSSGRFRYELPPLFDTATFGITGGDDWFGPVQIEPIDRPTVEGLTITAHVPGRSDPETYRADEAEKQLLFLPGTKLEMMLGSNQPLTAARAVVSGTELSRDLVRRPDQRYQLDWELKEPVTFEFQLKGDSGLESKPYFLTFGILNDRPPRLTLRSSGVGRRITPVARVPLHLRAIDDFGVAEISLELEETHLVDSKPVTSSHEPLKEIFDTDSTGPLPLDVGREPEVGITEFNLNPGTTIRFRAKASDACVLQTQTAESRWLTLQVVSADELFYEILTRQREQRTRFSKALEMAKDANDALVKVVKPSEASPIVRSHQTMTRQVWQVAGQLDATLTEMTLNDLSNAAARELLQTSVIQPLRELHDRPLAEQLKKLSSLTQGDNIDEDRREQVIESQAELIKQMQRILDQMSQWESFVDVVNQLRHVINSQNVIRESTEEMQKKQIKDVFDE